MNQFLYSYKFNHFNNVETIWDHVREAIYTAQRWYIPTLPARIINQPKWFTPFIRHKITCLHTLRRRFSVHPAQQLKQKNFNTEFELQQTMAQAKLDYES